MVFALATKSFPVWSNRRFSGERRGPNLGGPNWIKRERAKVGITLDGQAHTHGAQGKRFAECAEHFCGEWYHSILHEHQRTDRRCWSLSQAFPTRTIRADRKRKGARFGQPTSTHMDADLSYFHLVLSLDGHWPQFRDCISLFRELESHCKIRINFCAVNKFHWGNLHMFNFDTALAKSIRQKFTLMQPRSVPPSLIWLYGGMVLRRRHKLRLRVP